MKLSKINISFILMFTILLILPTTVHGLKPSDGNICVETGVGTNMYKLTKMGKSVLPGLVTISDIEGSSVYPKECFCSRLASGKGCVDEDNMCKKDYQFKASSQSKACKITSDNGDNGYEFSVCPTKATENIVSKMKNSMKVEYVAGTYNYRISFSNFDGYDGKVSAVALKKITSNGHQLFGVNADTGLPLSNSIARRYTAAEIKNGFDIRAGEDFYFIFYLNDSSDTCNGERLGYIQGAVSSKVKNPYFKTGICDPYKNAANGSLEKTMIPECFLEYISYNDLGSVQGTIQSRINDFNKIQALQGGDTIVKNNFKYTCDFKTSTGLGSTGNTVNSQLNFDSKTSFLETGTSGTYWRAVCTETISLDYDDPKALTGGQGFNYQAKVNVKRVCYPIKISEPQYRPTCEYSVECWGGPANHTGEAGAGPSEDFDKCIKSCDGGKYSQKCINSCYKEVYEDETNNSNYLTVGLSSKNILPSFLNSTKNYNLVVIASRSKGDTSLIGKTVDSKGRVLTRLPISSGCVISGNNKAYDCGVTCNSDSCNSEHGIHFVYLNNCNGSGSSSGTMCYEVYTNYPCTSNEDALKEYENAIEASKMEYDAVINAISKFNKDTINREEYKLSIDEEYDKQKNGKYKSKTTDFTNKNGNNTIKSSEVVSGVKTESLGTTERIANPNVEGLSAAAKEGLNKNISTYEISRTITLDVGAAYVSKTNGNEVLYNGKNTLTDPMLDKDPSYFPAENKYFTSYSTKYVNDYRNWPYYNSAGSYSTDSYTKNIHLNLKNIGSWNQWGNGDYNVDVDCFYGTNYGLVTDCVPGDSDCPFTCDPKVEVCSSGLTYIYRVIDLTDMFPNTRAARWNWTGTVSSTNIKTGAALLASESIYRDVVDPESVIKEVESKGETIYNVGTNSSEVDYEFVLTRENIRNIRAYNKRVKDYNKDGSRNYLDFNMSCYKNSRGQEVCTSNFMDNINGNSGSDDSANFITYSVNGFSRDSRKNLAGCNNAINGSTCYSVSR